MSTTCSCGCGCSDNAACGCCAGIAIVTPLPTDSPPGQPAIIYRVGTHAAFFETMKARLSQVTVPAMNPDGTSPPMPPPIPEHRVLQSLLRTREEDDSSIALLDAWAVVGDVLTFYQERIANEGYLRTATERLSTVELASLVGYEPRPGVAASVELAYTLNDHQAVTISAGSAVQSVPGPGQRPQTFETSQDLDAQSQFNNLAVRTSRPMNITADNAAYIGEIYLDGTSTNLTPGDPLLFIFDAADPASSKQVARFVRTVEPHPAKNPLTDKAYTLVTLEATSESVILVIQAIAQKYLAMLGPKPTGFAEDFSSILKSIATDRQLATLLIDFQNLRGLLTKYTSGQNGADSPPVVVWVNEVANALAAVFDTAPSSAPGLIPASGPDLFLSKQEDARKVLFEKLKPDVAVKPPQPVVQSLDARRDLQRQAVSNLIGSLSIQAVPAPDPSSLSQSFKEVFSPEGAALTKTAANVAASGWNDASLRLLQSLQPDLSDSVFKGLANTAVTPTAPLTGIYALRVKASVFGATAPLLTVFANGDTLPTTDWPLADDPATYQSILTLDSQVDQLTQGSWVYIDRGNGGVLQDPAADPNTLVTRISYARNIARANYGIAAKVTELQLQDQWRKGKNVNPQSFLTPFRRTTVYLRSELLPLADVPIIRPVGSCNSLSASQAANAGVDPGPSFDGVFSPESATVIELNSLYDGLLSGRRLIVTGERVDAPGVIATEAVVLLEAAQTVSQVAAASAAPVVSSQRSTLSGASAPDTAGRPGDSLTTTITLARPGLTYCYKRDTVAIYGNVVPATHGATSTDVLGSGNPATPLQSFPLRQGPLTYISAATTTGVQSTLAVRVNDVLWHEADDLNDLGLNARGFFTTVADNNVTTVTFGDGIRHGVRPPTGSGNIRATYRVGIGTPGNLDAGQLSQLMTRPLGVKAVINPEASSGGADRETIDSIRRSAPEGVSSLGRLVAVNDYADFSRTFGGVTKAAASLLSKNGRRLVYVTIAGAGAVPLDPQSDVCTNLLAALVKFGDPSLRVIVSPHEAKVLLLSASVTIDPDYLWSAVSAQVRAALLDAFSFDSRGLAQAVSLSQVIAVIQGQAGVTAVEVDGFNGIALSDLGGGAADDLLLIPDEVEKALHDSQGNLIVKSVVPSSPARRDPKNSGKFFPAQVVCFGPDSQDTLLLKEANS